MNLEDFTLSIVVNFSGGRAKNYMANPSDFQNNSGEYIVPENLIVFDNVNNRLNLISNYENVELVS